MRQVSGVAGVMTIVAMGLGSAVAVGDLRILASNISIIRNGLQFSPATTVFVSSLAILTLGATVLGAGVLGDKYGMRRMFLAGGVATVVFGFIGAAAPNVAVLMIARACIGVAFAFLTGLSLAIVNAVFPPGRRAGAIAWYLAAVYAFGVIPAMVGAVLTERLGWRSGLLVTPVLAVLVLVITLRYVPETQRSHRRTDVLGLVLIAIALVGLTYGVSQLQNGPDLESVASILTGVLALVGFAWWEARCHDPALDLRIFRSPRFNAVVAAGAANNLVQGGSMTMVTFYLVVIRDESTWVLALILIPATVVSALAAVVAGRAAVRVGNGAVVVAGLVVVLTDPSLWRGWTVLAVGGFLAGVGVHDLRQQRQKIRQAVVGMADGVDGRHHGMRCSTAPRCAAMCSVLSLWISYCGFSGVARCRWPL